MLITFEGTEGVGKSTHLKFLADYLSKKNIPLITTREPGGTEMGEEMRDMLLKHRKETMSPIAELLFMFAARAQHLETVILPALTAGKWVLCDRFTDATYAYQGGGRGVDMHAIKSLENMVQGSLRPHLVLLFDAPVEIGLSRATKRSHPDRFEQEKIEFFERVRAQYHMRAEEDLDRYKMIDATKSIEAIQNDLLGIFSPLVNKYHG
jgi:dTMP kinase